MTSQTITATGAGTFSVPSSVTSLTIEAWGAGASGAGSSSSTAPGGGGGGYSFAVVTVTPAQTVYYTVGAGPTGTTAAGTNGGVSWVNPAANSQPAANGVVAAGGTGGTSGNPAGGAGSIGTTNFTGGSAGAGGTLGGNTGGGGGGGAGSAANGGVGADANVPGPPRAGGSGGTPDGGNGGDGLAAGPSGNGTQPGGGGGGAWNSGAGGNGGDGQVRFTWTVSGTAHQGAATFAGASNLSVQLNRPSTGARALVGLNKASGIFKNFVYELVSLQSSGGYAFPAILDNNGYPTSTPTQNIFGLIYFPTSILSASDQFVIKWQGTGHLLIGRGSPGCTVVSDTGSVVVGATGTGLEVQGTNGRVVFTFTTSIPDAVSFSFVNSGTFSGLTNVVICRASDEASIDAATMPEQMFLPEFVSILRTANPKTLRMLGWNDVNEGNNITQHAQRKNWQTGYGFFSPNWIPGKWGGTASGTNTYACAAATDTPGSHTLGEVIQCQFTNANTSTTVTLNVGSRGAKTVKDMYGDAPAVGVITANVLATLIYDDLLDCWLYINDGLRSYIPLEYQVAICNLVGCNLWINYPPHILNASVSSMAAYIAANLHPSQSCYHEYANEVWNFGGFFHQTYWAQKCGTALGFTGSNDRNVYGWYALRVRQIMALVTAEGGNYKRVNAFQAYGPTGTSGATNVYRLQGADLDTSLGYTGYNSYVGVTYSASPNRPIDYCDTISYATYYSGAQCTDFDANYSSSNISGLTNAADLFATSTAPNIATAFAFLDNDIRSGTRSAVLYSQTIDYQVANIYPAWETIAASYDATHPLTVECYEGGMECAPPSTAQCTTMGISTTYGGSTGSIANLINGYKQNALFYDLVTDQFNLLFNKTHSVAPAWLIINPSDNQWAMTMAGQDAMAPKFQSWDAFVDFNTTATIILRPSADDTSGTWTNESGGVALFTSIDEPVADDSDYIQSAPAPNHDICKIRLSGPPGLVMLPATARYRFKKRGDTRIDLDVSLLQGTTEIAKWSESDIGTSFVDGSQALTVPQFNSITDFSDLFLQFDASGAWWLAGASIDLDFSNARYYDSSDPTVAVTDFLSCSRASIGYAKNADGTLTQFASNTLRIGVGMGLLVEDARTNLFLWSQDFSNASWEPTAILSTSLSGTAPDGTSTSRAIIPTTANTFHNIRERLITLTNNPATVSVYAKANGYNFITLLLANNDSNTKYYYQTFDLSNGTATADSGSVTYTGSFSIEAMGSGWYWCKITVDATDANSTAVAILAVYPATPGVSYAGDGSSGVLMWGAQLEQASFPSSYIPTTTVAATRAADNITNIGVLATNIAAATGSIVAEISNAEAASFAANIVDSNGTNLLGFDATNHALASITATLATGNTANRNATADKLGIAWDASGRSLVLNNSTVATDATAQTPNATQHLGSSGSANFAFAYIKRLTVWTSKLADATLQALTAP